jgi:hypothetical protein
MRHRIHQKKAAVPRALPSFAIRPFDQEAAFRYELLAAELRQTGSLMQIVDNMTGMTFDSPTVTGAKWHRDWNRWIALLANPIQTRNCAFLAENCIRRQKR